MYIKEHQYHFYDCFLTGVPLDADDHIWFHYYLWKGNQLKIIEYRNKLLLRYHGLIFGFIRRLKCVVDDDFYYLAVDTLIKCLHAFDVTQPFKFSGYFYRALRNEWVKFKIGKTTLELHPDIKSYIEIPVVDTSIILDTLEPQQAELLRTFYGIGQKRLTLRELGERENVTHETIRQRIDRLIKKLRKQHASI